MHIAYRAASKALLRVGIRTPIVVMEGRFRFVVNTRENSFEPPHVHVWVGSEEVCRIELNGGSFMEDPPSGSYGDMMKAYARHAEEIGKAWDSIHGGTDD